MIAALVGLHLVWAAVALVHLARLRGLRAQLALEHARVRELADANRVLLRRVLALPRRPPAVPLTLRRRTLEPCTCGECAACRGGAA